MMANQIGTTTDSGRFVFQRRPTTDLYDVLADEVFVGTVWRIRSRLWRAHWPGDRLLREAFPTRLAAARALTEDPTDG